jgi:DNA replication protein DnaC
MARTLKEILDKEKMEREKRAARFGLTIEPANTSTPTVTECQPKTVAELKWKEDICPECHTPQDVGYYRGDFEVGHTQFGKLIKCQNVFHSTTREARMAAVSTLGPEDIKIRLKDINTNPYNLEMIVGCQEAIKRGYGWLYLHGGPGNAKSVALKAIVNEMNASGRGPALFTTFYQVLMYVKSAFRPDSIETELDKFNRLIAMPVLAIDEIGQVKETDWLEAFRFNFLNARYEAAINKKGLTIFAGNHHPRQIFAEADPFGALLDRITDGRFKVIENKQQSARQGEKW